MDKNCYVAEFEDVKGLIKLTPANTVSFTAKKSSFEFPIESIINVSLWAYDKEGEFEDSSNTNWDEVEFDGGVFINTESGKDFYLAVENREEFAVQLEQKRRQILITKLYSAS